MRIYRRSAWTFLCLIVSLHTLLCQDSTVIYRQPTKTVWSVAKWVLPTITFAGGTLYALYTKNANDYAEEFGRFNDEYERSSSKAKTFGLIGVAAAVGSIAVWTLGPKDTTFAEKNIDIQFTQSENPEEQKSNPNLPQINIQPPGNFVDSTTTSSYRIVALIGNVFNPKLVSLYARDLREITEPTTVVGSDGVTAIWSISLKEGLNEYILVAVNSFGRSARKILIVRQQPN